MNVEFLNKPIRELDAIFRLKDVDSNQLKSLFTPLDAQPLTRDEAQELWDLLQSPQISKLEQLNGIPETLCHFLVLVKVATTMKVEAMKLLLGTVPKVTHEIQYWEDRKSSDWSVLWYFLQLLPQNAPMLHRMPFVSKILGSRRVSFKEGSWFEKVKEFGNTSPYRIGMKQMNGHVHHLKRMNRVQAHCLGLMASSTTLHSYSSTDIGTASDLQILVNTLYHPTTPANDWVTVHQNIINQLKELVIAELHGLETIVGSLSDFEMLSVGKPQINDFVPDSVQSLVRISQLVHSQHFKFEKHFERHARPTFLIRYWPQIAVGFMITVYSYRLFTMKSVIEYCTELITNSVDTLSSFVREWLVRPCQEMLKTIRHKDSNLKIMGQNSLSSDLDSLERMVIDFAKDHVPKVNVAEISEQIKSGDMTAVLQEYEKEIQSPLKSFVKGNLIRALLIQVQKVKVDGGFALSALDKLLKSNELNFAFLAVMPTLLVTYGTVSWARLKLGNRRGFGFSQKMMEIRLCLRDIERLLNTESNNLTVGYLLCHMVHLRELIQNSSFPLRVYKAMMEDLTDLENIILEKRGDGILVLNRIWRSYPIISLL